MSVRLWPVLPKDNDRNGLGAIERALIDDPEREHLVVAVINQRRTTTDADTGETTPAARVLHIEAIDGDNEEAARVLAPARANQGRNTMPFAFTAVGTKAEVIAQCRTHDIDHGGDLAIAARNLITEALENDLSSPGPRWHYAYVVKAVGHGNNGAGVSSGPTSLSLTIEVQCVPDAVVVVVAQSASGTLTSPIT